MSKNVSALSFRKGLEKNLFERMVESAGSGSGDSDGLKGLAEEYLIGDAITLGAVSFYDFLKEENSGKKAFICNGTACMTAGTQGDLKELIGEYLKEEEIGEICCLGRCHENGSFQYGGVNYSGKSDDELGAILSSGEGSSSDDYATASNMGTDDSSDRVSRSRRVL